VQQPVAPPLQNLTQSRPFTAQTGRTPPAPAPVVAPADTPFARSMNAAQAQLDQQTARPADPPSVASPRPRAAAPLDAQAATDRATAAAAAKTGLGFLDSAGRAIADVATLVPRGLAGAYDTAVVRPMRAAGIDAAYLSPKLVPQGANPSSMTPFMDQKRARMPAETEAPDVASPATVAQTSDSARPAGAPAAPAKPDAPTTQASNNQPNPTPAASPATDPNAPKVDPMTGVQVGNTVQANRQPNGVMEFSGSNITSGFNYGGNAGFRPGGAGVNVMPAANFVQASPSLQAQVAQARAQADGTAGFFSGSRGDLGGNQNATVMSGDGFGILSRDRQQSMAAQDAMTPRPGESRANFAARLQAASRQAEIAASERTSNRTNETQRRGQDLQVETATADRTQRERIETGRQSLDERRFATEQTAAGFKTRAAETQEALFKQWTEAKTPEEKASALERLRVLQGGDASPDQSRLVVVPGGQEWNEQAGAVLTRPGFLYDQSSRQFIQMPGQSGGSPAAAAAPRAVGSTSEINGKFSVWDGMQWIPQ